MKKENARMAGVLMPVSSLPSADGVGGFGNAARHFVDDLSDMGFKIWQVLPLNPLGYGNSPYQPYSSYAGDEIYIDLDELAKRGYLSSKRERVPAFGRVDYSAAREHKLHYLRDAFRSFEEQGKEKDAFEAFCREEWVYPYAVYITLRKNNDMRCWNEWPKEQRDWIFDRAYDITPFEEEIRFQMFLQYEFRKQWNALREYANSKGILIMGDIPFYVGLDSLDVWQNRENFLLDQDGRPRFIAGVPPDYFSPTGQRWENPVYNWETLEKNGFIFWTDRLRYTRNLYDIIRIDHFRAFDTFWEIPASCMTAEDGEWVKAPGYAVLDKIFEEIPDIQIVAEDLGDLTEDVHKLRDAYDLPGMNVAQFSLMDPGERKNQVIYTGTHDNQTVRGWYEDLEPGEKEKVDRFLEEKGGHEESISYRMIDYVFQSIADCAIIPVMDLLELDDAARLNTPGTEGSPNWEWQLEDLAAINPYREHIRQMLKDAKRV